MIMGRAAVPPGQSGRNGHVRARREGGSTRGSPDELQGEQRYRQRAEEEEGRDA